MPELLHSTSEVARMFNINRVTIYRWVQEGIVTAYRVGKHLKIPASEVERMKKEFGFPKRKKLVVSIVKDKTLTRVVQEVFMESPLKEGCRLEVIADDLDAALFIGKEQPDLLIMNDPNSVSTEFTKKIKDIYNDIKIIEIKAQLDGSRNESAEKQHVKEIDWKNGFYEEVIAALGI